MPDHEASFKPLSQCLDDPLHSACHDQEAVQTCIASQRWLPSACVASITSNEQLIEHCPAPLPVSIPHFLLSSCIRASESLTAQPEGSRNTHSRHLWTLLACKQTARPFLPNLCSLSCHPNTCCNVMMHLQSAHRMARHHDCCMGHEGFGCMQLHQCGSIRMLHAFQPVSYQQQDSACWTSLPRASDGCYDAFG